MIARRLGRWLTGALDAVSIAYPILVLFLVRPFGPVAIVIGLVGILILRMLLGLGRRTPPAMTIAAMLAATILVAITAINPDIAVRAYPALMSAAMLTVFAASLIWPPTIIEQIARLAEGDLPPAAIAYTRKVTWVWCGFFVLNGAIALWSALKWPLEAWALYNGLISYLLMGCLFAGEFLIRRRVRAAHEAEQG